MVTKFDEVQQRLTEAITKLYYSAIQSSLTKAKLNHSMILSNLCQVHFILAKRNLKELRRSLNG